MTTTPTSPSSHAQPKALITGSAAPFAQRLVDQLATLGWEVDTIVHRDSDVLPPTHSLHMFAPASDVLATGVQNADAVILLSGIDSLTSMVDDSRDLDTVLAEMKPGAALIEVTTMAVYGDAAGDHTVAEGDAPVVPDELDPVAACEIRVLAAGDWLRSIVVRPGLVYGDGGGLALAPAVEFARARRASRYFGDGNEILPTVHEEELLDLLTRVVTDPSARGIYHATSGSVTTRELADVVAAAAGIDTVEPWNAQALQDEFGTTRQPPRVSVSTAAAVGRATSELGWRPAARSLMQSLGL